ncbi:hypothetical protein NEF87_003350 [Candidatus Lokiarchaeum ossiferum]|uniref:Histidine kinase N-terminal 7TM region domain-containing protein n=1 Tax=Candidatus Lokiarchaeum ossiferum TaxID=2951803 RepID=A0ABY6HU69_9ARCH|nr:hypothetical protein NEF87_003350 [Candidatus Lokiarchaeum sp. B-35]
MIFIENSEYTFTTIESIVMIIYGGFIILLLMFGWDLLGRFIKADKRMRGDPAYMVFFIIAVAMLGYGIYMFPALVDYFFVSDLTGADNALLWIVPFKYALILCMIVPIAYVCLLILLKNRRRIANILGLIGVLPTIYIFIITIITGNNPSINVGFTSPLILPVVAFIAIFAVIDFIGIVYILIVELAPQKEVRNRVLLGILGIVIAGIGGFIEVSSRDSLIDNPDNWWYVYGTFIELFGFIVMRHFFLSIPSYDEFAWKNGMIEMHVIIAETGISLHYQSFAELKANELKGDIKVTATLAENEARPNSDLVAGGLVGIKGMLAEISGDRGKLENIEIGEKSLVFKQGKTILCLLLADENLGVYHSLLDDLVTRIEEEHPGLDNFNGDTRKLHIAPIVEEVFDLTNQGILKKTKKKKKKSLPSNTSESEV